MVTMVKLVKQVPKSETNKDKSNKEKLVDFFNEKRMHERFTPH